MWTARSRPGAAGGENAGRAHQPWSFCTRRTSRCRCTRAARRPARQSERGQMLRSQWYGRTTGAQLPFADHADKVGRQRAAGGVPAEAAAVAAGATPREGEQGCGWEDPGGDGSHLAAEHAGEASVLRDLHLLDLLTHGRTVARTVLACDPDLLGVLAHLGAGFLTAKRVAARRRREAAEPSDEPAGPTIQGQFRFSRENFTCP